MAKIILSSIISVVVLAVCTAAPVGKHQHGKYHQNRQVHEVPLSSSSNNSQLNQIFDDDKHYEDSNKHSEPVFEKTDDLVETEDSDLIASDEDLFPFVTENYLDQPLQTEQVLENPAAPGSDEDDFDDDENSQQENAKHIDDLSGKDMPLNYVTAGYDINEHKQILDEALGKEDDDKWENSDGSWENSDHDNDDENDFGEDDDDDNDEDDDEDTILIDDSLEKDVPYNIGAYDSNERKQILDEALGKEDDDIWESSGGGWENSGDDYYVVDEYDYDEDDEDLGHYDINEIRKIIDEFVGRKPYNDNIWDNSDESWANSDDDNDDENNDSSDKDDDDDSDDGADDDDDSDDGADDDDDSDDGADDDDDSDDDEEDTIHISFGKDVSYNLGPYDSDELREMIDAIAGRTPYNDNIWDNSDESWENSDDDNDENNYSSDEDEDGDDDDDDENDDDDYDDDDNDIWASSEEKWNFDDDDDGEDESSELELIKQVHHDLKVLVSIFKSGGKNDLRHGERKVSGTKGNGPVNIEIYRHAK